MPRAEKGVFRVLISRLPCYGKLKAGTDILRTGTDVLKAGTDGRFTRTNRAQNWSVVGRVAQFPANSRNANCSARRINQKTDIRRHWNWSEMSPLHQTDGQRPVRRCDSLHTPQSTVHSHTVQYVPMGDSPRSGQQSGSSAKSHYNYSGGIISLFRPFSLFDYSRLIRLIIASFRLGIWALSDSGTHLCGHLSEDASPLVLLPP